MERNMRLKIISPILLVLTFLFFDSSLFAQETPVLRAVKIDRNLEIKGDLGDPLWETAQTVELLYEVEITENKPATQRTFAKVLYNNEFIYFGFLCEDQDPSLIRAQISDRDRAFNDDFVLVIFDVYGDNQRAYEFFVNPYGIQGDILRTGNNEDTNFDTIWKSEAKINFSGWTAEMAIPFKSLRFPLKSDQTWTLLLARNYPRDSRYIFSWTPISRNNPCLTCQGGKLVGITGVESFSTYDLLPYAVGMQSGVLRDRSDASSFENGPVKGRIGAGVRYAPHPDFSLEAVINPDFSQVETDAAQISVNTTFSLFYPEKRPYFLAGNDQFSTRINAFHSRMINNPLASAKLTTRIDKFSIAHLTAYDRESPYIIPGPEGSSFIASSLKSLSNIFRSRYDFGSQSFIGAIMTSRNVERSHNYVGGFDWSHNFWENFYFSGQALMSDTREVNDLTLFSSNRALGETNHTAGFDGERFQGTAFSTSLSQSTRNFYWSLNYRDYSPTFQSHTGFLTKNDQRMGRYEFSYRIYPESGFVDRINLHTEGGIVYDHSGQRKERWIFTGINAALKSQTYVFVGWIPINQETFRNVYFPSVERFMVNINTNPSSVFSMYASAEFGKYIHRTSTPELGKGHNLSIGTTVKPTSQLSVSLSYSRSRLSRVSNGQLLYDGYIARKVTAYQFTQNIFFRMIGQYDHFSKKLDLYPLFSYKLNPFTIFYVGSTYAYTDLPNIEEPRFTNTNRQYFLKFQYLLRY